MATYDYLRSEFIALGAKVESTSGTFETITMSTDAIPVEEADFALNPVNRQSKEANNSIATSPDVIVRVEPTISGTLQLHGSGAPATDSPATPILKSGGLALTTATVIPASGTTTATAGTTTSFTINTAVATDWSATSGSYIGRIVQLAGNPAAGAYRHVKSYVVTAGNAVVTVDGEPFGSALSSSTTAKLLPGKLWVPSSAATSTISLEHYRDGHRLRFAGGRSTFGFAFPGNDIPTLTNLKIDSTYVSNAGASASGVDFSAVPTPPDWSSGVCSLNGTLIAATNLTLDLGNTSKRHPNPNKAQPDQAITTKRNIRGELTPNMELPAVQDRIALMLANTDMAFSAICDTTRSAGARVALHIPRLRILDKSYSDNGGIADDKMPFQANGTDALPEFYLFESW